MRQQNEQGKVAGVKQVEAALKILRVETRRVAGVPRWATSWALIVECGEGGARVSGRVGAPVAIATTR
jgi:hypothetical protein